MGRPPDAPARASTVARNWRSHPVAPMRSTCHADDVCVPPQRFTTHSSSFVQKLLHAGVRACNTLRIPVQRRFEQLMGQTFLARNPAAGSLRPLKARRHETILKREKRTFTISEPTLGPRSRRFYPAPLAKTADCIGKCRTRSRGGERKVVRAGEPAKPKRRNV